MARTMYRKTQKSKLIQKFSFQPVDHIIIQEPYIALIDMHGQDHQTQGGTPNEWSDYVLKVSSIISTMLLVSSVLMTPTLLKMTSETYKY